MSPHDLDARLSAALIRAAQPMSPPDDLEQRVLAGVRRRRRRTGAGVAAALAVVLAAGAGITKLSSDESARMTAEASASASESRRLASLDAEVVQRATEDVLGPGASFDALVRRLPAGAPLRLSPRVERGRDSRMTVVVGEHAVPVEGMPLQRGQTWQSLQAIPGGAALVLERGPSKVLVFVTGAGARDVVTLPADATGAAVAADGRTFAVVSATADDTVDPSTGTSGLADAKVVLRGIDGATGTTARMGLPTSAKGAGWRLASVELLGVVGDAALVQRSAIRLVRPTSSPSPSGSADVPEMSIEQVDDAVVVHRDGRVAPLRHRFWGAASGGLVALPDGNASCPVLVSLAEAVAPTLPKRACQSTDAWWETSPNGRYRAAIRYDQNSARLVVEDVRTHSQRTVEGFEGADVPGVLYWESDARLLVVNPEPWMASIVGVDPRTATAHRVPLADGVRSVLW